jgi:hypothetical protein
MQVVFGAFAVSIWEGGKNLHVLNTINIARKPRPAYVMYPAISPHDDNFFYSIVKFHLDRISSFPIGAIIMSVLNLLLSPRLSWSYRTGLCPWCLYFLPADCELPFPALSLDCISAWRFHPRSTCFIYTDRAFETRGRFNNGAMTTLGWETERCRDGTMLKSSRRW